MAFSSSFLVLSLFALLAFGVHGQLSGESFYQRQCPRLRGNVRSTMARVGGLHSSFHDCFVNGCDALVLLDDTRTFTDEKNAAPNKNPARGFEVIDAIKSRVEAKCKGVVSCADILALAARDGVALLGGPSWKVQLGRRDARTASLNVANTQLPPPSASLSTVVSMFAAKGLNARDMTEPSGAHTIGQAQCVTLHTHIHNGTNIDSVFAALRKRTYPIAGGNGNLAPLDGQTPNRFDNSYYKNLVARRGLLHSDQVLSNGGSQDSLVRLYSQNPRVFWDDFVRAMVKMGSISPLTRRHGEIRLNCRVVN